ncbi:MAG TPA: hypothetical protein VK465_17050, partial [Fibrobacteria bacterium]|nr:hypothetical protein [Fibrobacteria bacterium]
SALATAYADSAMVRPEIYVKGTRNPYSINVDPKTGWVVWGDFGPTQQRVEEVNLHTRPGYAGYPYWAGRNIFVLDKVNPWGSAGMDPKAPINNSRWNTGPKELPPAEPAVLAFAHEGPNSALLRDGYPTTGPIYRYDGDLDSPVKFPPHFDGAWMVTGRIVGFRLYRINASGDGVTDSAVFKGALDEPSTFWNRPLELKQGPDGAVYMLEYHAYHSTSHLTHIGRYEYTGTCRPGVDIPVASRSKRPKGPRVHVSARAVRVEEPGPHRIRVRDLDGREVAAFEGAGPREHALDLKGSQGLHIVTLEPGGGSWIVPSY